VKRVPEPELMDGEAQALAYAQADFSEPHKLFVERFRLVNAGKTIKGWVLDLGCGPADITVRFAHAWQNTQIVGVDGAEVMIAHAGQRIIREALSDRINVKCIKLPGGGIPYVPYDVIISNSLLHHLADPLTLWGTIVSASVPGSLVFVMDLLRPNSVAQVEALVDCYAAEEPGVLRADFRNSLKAAYKPEEIIGQLQQTGLEHLQTEVISDRHFIVYGEVQNVSSTH